MTPVGESENANGSAPYTAGAAGAVNKVFISYASQDVAVAEKLCAALEAASLPCWIAPRDVRAGESYAAAIVQAINSCRMLVLVLSKSAIESSHVLREIERASSKNRPVLSVRMDAAELPPDLEYFLSAKHWLDASRCPVEQILPALVESVRGGNADKTPRQAVGVSVRGARTSPDPGPSTAPSKAPLRSGKRAMTVALALVVVGFAYLLTDKFWLSKHGAAEKATARVAPATTPVPPFSEKSIAVLPFADMSEKKDQEYFADGMAEEIINLLARVPNLRIPARTSSFYFKGKSTKVPDIARELGVAHILEGSIRRSGSQIRVTAQLVRADTGFDLWSQTYDRDLHDVFKVQDDIANAVVQALQISLMGGPLTRQAGGTQNLEAYQLSLRALDEYEHNTKESLAAAREHTERAIKLDPDFALAWTMLGWTTTALAQLRILPLKDGYERARQLAQHAQQLSPELTEAHLLLGYIHRSYDWDWAAAQAETRQALAIDPTNSYVLLLAGQVSATLGHWDDAERQLRAALARDPLSTDTYWQLATTLYRAGRFAEAEAVYRKLIELAPDYAWARGYLAQTLLAEGKPEAALPMAQQERDEANRLDILPIALQAAGRHAESDEALNVLATKYADSDAYYVAMNYAYRGDHDLALQWLERAYQQKDAAFVVFVGEPLFKNLANDPRYKAFLRKMNLPE